ncbi:MAG: DUF1587 domain-containing protein [Planctomycetaceae bacterium]|nr:DUF1587 domain-containing protein [Planctomycetaceae bacterium]
MRRLNRNEYRNTIRDLIGVNADVSGFPQDPPAGGFDNNGRALTVSPLLMELYLASARKILDEAIVEGAQPEALKWHSARLRRFRFKSSDVRRATHHREWW